MSLTLDIRFLLTMFAIFPAIIGLIKYKRVDILFRPFIFMMWLEIPTEVFNYLCDKIHLSKILHYTNINVYMLLNFYLFLLFANNFNFINKNLKNIVFTVAVFIGILNIFFEDSFRLLFYLLFYVSFVMLAISIDILSKQIMAIKQPLLNNFWFWMSSTSVIYNAQTLLVFSIYYLALVNIPNSKILGNIETIANATCRILFGIAMLKMPETYQSSFSHKR